MMRLTKSAICLSFAIVGIISRKSVLVEKAKQLSILSIDNINGSGKYFYFPKKGENMSEVKPLLSAGMGINMSYDGQAETAYPLPPTIEAKIGGSFNVGPLALDLNVGLNGVSYVDLFGTVQGVLGPKSRNWDVGGLAGVDVNNDHDPIFGGLFQVALSQGDNTRLALQGEVSHQPIDSITRGGISLVIDTTAL